MGWPFLWMLSDLQINHFPRQFITTESFADGAAVDHFRIKLPGFIGFGTAQDFFEFTQPRPGFTQLKQPGTRAAHGVSPLGGEFRCPLRASAGDTNAAPGAVGLPTL